MADIIVDGLTRVVFIPTLTNPASPTVAQITAGTYLNPSLTADGLAGFEASPGEVDNTSYSALFDTKAPGVASYSGTRLNLKKQQPTDAIHTLLTTFGTAGYIGVRDGKSKDAAVVAGDKLQIFPIITGTWDYMARERNSVLKYWVATPISDAPVPAATVVA